MQNDFKILLLINLFSGNGKAKKVAQEIKTLPGKRGIPYTYFNDSRPVKLSGFTDIWLAGGDGTVNYFISKYQDCEIPLAVFKGGTGNDLAWRLYGDIPVQQQIELVLNAKASFIDAGICNGMLYVNSPGIGFDGEVLRSINTVRRLRGHLGYLAVVLKKIFSFREYNFIITAGAEAFNSKSLLVVINNSSRSRWRVFNNN